MRIISLLIVLILIDSTSPTINDRSFFEFCTKKNGQPQRETEGSFKADKCVINMEFYVETQEEAEYHCKRWGIFPLVSAVVSANRAQCTYENVYACSQDYTQIRGMCYKRLPKLMEFNEAIGACSSEAPENVEILQYYDELGELLDDNIDDLSMYFVKPDESLDKEPRFFGGTGNIYILLFSHAIHFRAGYNTIHRFDRTQKAYVICQYRPKETSLSFAINVAKLEKGYYPSIADGAHLLWRTVGHYARTDYKHQSLDSREKELKCEKSMKAIFGTDYGTLADPNKQLTSMLTQEVKDSFVVAYAPIEHCQKNGVFHYFRSKEKFSVIYCQDNTALDNSNYNGDFKTTPIFTSKTASQYSAKVFNYLYMPQKLQGYTIETRELGYHAPMLCTIDIHHVSHPCQDWYMARYNGKPICLLVIQTVVDYANAKKTCENQTPAASIAIWHNNGEYQAYNYYRRVVLSSRNSWVGCRDINDCSSGNLGSASLTGSSLITGQSETIRQFVMCMREPQE